MAQRQLSNLCINRHFNSIEFQFDYDLTPLIEIAIGINETAQYI